MNAFVCPDLLSQAPVPEKGILSRTIHDDASLRLVVLSFSAGHELSPHTTPKPVTIHLLQGSARILLGTETHVLEGGALVRMPAGLEHGVTALTPMTLLLAMEKTA